MNTRAALVPRVLITLFVVTVLIFVSTGNIQAGVVAQDIPADDPGSAPSDSAPPVVEVISPYFSIEHRTLADGTQIGGYIINGPPAPPAGYAHESTTLMSSIDAVILPDFPSYNWVFGCSAVSGAMIAAYYDRGTFTNMYAGPTNGGIMPLTDTSWATWSDGYKTYPNNPLIASHDGVDGRSTKGSIDDYWVKYDSTADDPYIGNWTQHSWGTAIGDYMKTSQSAYDNTDGSTAFYNYVSSGDRLTCSAMEGASIDDHDGTYGRKLFYEARGYTVTDCYNQKTDNNAGGFTLANFQAEIDAGNPVLLNLAGHSIVGYGYNGSTIYIRDTWDNNPSHTYSMPWGGSYEGMELLSVSVVHLQPPSGHRLVLTVLIMLTTQDPTDILLSNSSLAENQPINTVIGTLSTIDPNAGDTFTYSLVSGAGSSDNGSFNISGNQLRSSAVFDYETKNNYSIRIRTTDQDGLYFEKVFTISITPASNQDPTDILLSNSSLAENQPINTVIGTLSTIDPNAGDTFTYSLVSGVGSSDNGSFNISGNQLRSSAVFDYETKNNYSIRIRTTDQDGLYFEKAFTISITFAGWETLVNTTFEGDFPGSWDVFDNDSTSNGVYYWASRTCRAYEGSSSGWAVGGGSNGSSLGCGSNYPDYANSWMIYGPFSLEEATDAEFVFMYWLNSEPVYDYLFVGASINGTNFYGEKAYGSQNWTEKNFDLTDVYTLGDLTGESAVWVVIGFLSDSSVNYSEGAYVDNVVLRRCYQASCPGLNAPILEADGSQLVERPWSETIHR